MKNLFCVLIACCLLLVACQREPVVPAIGFAPDELLCLTVERSDDSLLATIAAARARPRSAAAWIDVGRARLERAFARADGGELPQVAACARAARQRDVFSVASLELEASVALGGHRFAEALELTEHALAQDPVDANLWGIRSDALLELGRYAEAAQAAREQMRLWPGAAAQARAAYFQWLAGNVEAAKRDLVVALRGRDARTPAFNAWLWSEIARIYLHEGAYADAATMYARSLAELPGFPPALIGAARVALAQRRVSEGEAFAREALTTAPSVEAAIVLGDALAAKGETAAAETSWRQAEDLGRRGDALGLARFLAERGRDPARALRLLQRQALGRDSLELREALAWAHYRNGDCRSAASALAPLRELGVRDARLRLHAAIIEAECGDVARAAALYAHGERLDVQIDVHAARTIAARFPSSPEMVAR
ncbi:MAG: tetratricopeptide repeat protein [Xanthomonadales bacterium]|nr:hypothetical protein [Xanthomonadales bacterium]MCC6594748.1 tetratricopeptide repeat protein [Xanthomonadales bacterium]MCE7932451.1 hypothetical protein [Xanthomonadales bacterium PRO6]